MHTSKKKYPITIDSGTGEQLTFLGLQVENGVEYMLVENLVAPQAGPPMHVHHKQHEEVTILEGVMGAQILGEEPKYYKAGDTVCFEAGVVHKFWNAGDTMLKGKGRVWPALNFEYFLTEIYRSMKLSGTHRPGLMDSAFLLRRYKSEFDMIDIPPFVKKVIMPIAYQIGKMTGAYKKFDNAPSQIM